MHEEGAAKNKMKDSFKESSPSSSLKVSALFLSSWFTGCLSKRSLPHTHSLYWLFGEEVRLLLEMTLTAKSESCMQCIPLFFFTNSRRTSFSCIFLVELSSPNQSISSSSSLLVVSFKALLLSCQWISLHSCHFPFFISSLMIPKMTMMMMQKAMKRSEFKLRVIIASLCVTETKSIFIRDSPFCLRPNVLCPLIHCLESIFIVFMGIYFD